MRLFSNFRSALTYGFAAAVIITLTSVFAAAQAFVPTKVAVIDTDLFSDPKAGITRLVTVMNSLDREMKPRRDEIAVLQARLEKLGKEVSDTSAIADPKTIAAKRDEADRIQVDIKRKAEDGQAVLNRRSKEMTDPIYTDIMVALEAYVKKRGIDIVIDLAKSQSVMVGNSSVDITAAFIAEYNAKPVSP